MARRWCYYFNGNVAFYFGHMFINLGLTQFPGRHLPHSREVKVRTICDDWMSHQFQPNGEGSPFPLRQLPGTHVDMTKLDIWGQMNAYSAEHFQ